MPARTRRTRYMLDAERIHELTAAPGKRFLPVVAGLANLFLCVFFEHPIKEDSGHQALAAFLVVQAMVFAGVVLAHYGSSGMEVLRKSMVFPVTPFDRFLFSVASAARQPVLVVLVLTDIFFLLVLFHSTWIAVVGIPVLLLIFGAIVLAATCLGALASTRSSRPPTEFAALCFLAFFGAAGVPLVFRIESVIDMLPPISWAWQGILACVQGRPGAALLHAAESAALLAAIVMAGRRFA